MKGLVGSEKRVAWAEDIREGKTKVVAGLREAVALLEDFTQEEVSGQDLFGNPLPTGHRVYTAKLRPEHEAAFSAARPWYPGSGLFPEIDFVAQRSKEHAFTGGEHADRKATRDLYAETLAALETALEEQAEAEYWIDRR